MYLVESLGQAESVQDEDAQARSLASTIRLSLATWRRQLHELRAMVPHRLDGQDHRVHCVAVDARGRFMAHGQSLGERCGGVVLGSRRKTTATTPGSDQDRRRSIEAIAFAHDGQTLASVGRMAGYRMCHPHVAVQRDGCEVAGGVRPG